MAEHLAAESLHLLDIDAGDVDVGEPEQLGERLGRAARVDDRRPAHFPASAPSKARAGFAARGWVSAL